MFRCLSIVQGAELSYSLQGLDVCECVRTNQAVTLSVDHSAWVCVQELNCADLCKGFGVCECVRTNQAVTLSVDTSVRVCAGAGSTRVSPFLCQEGHHIGHGQE